MMAQEEHTQKCSNSSSGGGGGGCGGGSGSGSGGGNNRSSSQKLKQKKVPQRGLGVAQLEKIRLEEQKKKDAALQLQAATILSPSNSSSCLAVRCPSFRLPPNLSPPPPPLPPIPLPPPPSTDLPTPNSLFRPSSSVPNVENFHPNSNSIKALNMGGGGEMGWSGSSGYGNWPNWWSGEYNSEGENHSMDPHHGFSFPCNANLPPYDSHTSPIWPLPSLMQRSQQLLQHSSSKMVNVSSGTSSSVLNFQIEPPSNQTFCSNKYTPLWPEEDKIVGMKRPCPFSLDNPPGPSFHCKIAPSCVAPMARLDESPSCSNGSMANIESGHNPNLREGPSGLDSLWDLNSKKISNGNGNLSGDFLSLAPPATDLPQLRLKNKHHSAYLSPFICESSDLEPTSYLGNSEDQQNHWMGAGEAMQQPFFSFFPSARAQNGQAAASLGNCHGQLGESVDLNLRL